MRIRGLQNPFELTPNIDSNSAQLTVYLASEILSGIEQSNNTLFVTPPLNLSSLSNLQIMRQLGNAGADTAYTFTFTLPNFVTLTSLGSEILIYFPPLAVYTPAAPACINTQTL